MTRRHMTTSAAAALAAVAGTALLAACERPPTERQQMGYRGTGMVEVENPRLAGREKARQLAALPEIYPPPPASGQRAGDFYDNVQVLGDLDVTAFDRLMVAITEWVSPEEGCNYCHIPTDLASDDVYTKVVARRMLEMTQHVNMRETAHVGETGVTCFTCHRGEPVPTEVWYSDTAPPQAGGFAADRQGQNLASASVGSSSLPYDPFSPYLAEDGANAIRVQPLTALPTGVPTDIMRTEQTYALMMHMSGALGVNCAYCHNSRAFFDWEQSTQQRTTAWHGIAMTRTLNTDFLMPLTPAFPEERLGPMGDVAKVNCTTCHQGVSKPLDGAPVLEGFPSLAEVGAGR